MKEIFHFLRHAPATLALKRRLSQRELYDVVMDRADASGLANERKALTANLAGTVLEVGCGTGHMFSHYPATGRAEVIALEIDPAFAELARARASALPHITVREGDAERMPIEDASIDVVIIALVLCSVGDPMRVLAETRRVLRPGGQVRLIEHVRSTGAAAGLAMDLANPIWLALNGQGCRMNRNTERTLASAGFVLEEVHAFKLFAAGLPAFPMRRIVAHPPSGITKRVVSTDLPHLLA